MIILRNVCDLNIPALTWSGGEALLYKGIKNLIKTSHVKGITNRLITNGQLCDINVFQHLDELVISIDSVDSNINALLGRGRNHFENVFSTLQCVQLECPNLPVRINTMISRINKDNIFEIYNFITRINNVYKWRINKFSPLRGKAKENIDFFTIADTEFDLLLKKTNEWNAGRSLIIQSRQEADFEHNYMLIIPDGNIVVTRNKEDLKLGSAKNIDIFRKSIYNINWMV
jgi:radical S-adenosyl methionine domain-containing protein 2